VKSGWACAVLVTGSASAPRVVDSRRIDLSDPSIPESRQPYHAGFGTARNAGADLSRLVSSVKRFGRRSAAGVIREYRSTGHELRGVGVVVGSLIDPETIENDHIRIHALEGRLFRSVVEDAAGRCRLACSLFRERDLYVVATATFHQPDHELRVLVTALGRAISGSWRAEQKVAALAAWLVLAGRA
jgi:hypothetical protein